MKSVGFYLMNKKGLKTIYKIIDLKKDYLIKYVVCSRDSNVINDYYEDIKALCKLNNILFLDRKEEFFFKVDYKIAIGWRWIIKNSENLIVFHDSILPGYRGFSPLVNCLINEEKEIGVTALFASDDYDRGEIIEQKKINIEYPITIKKAIDLIGNVYEDLAISILEKIEKHTLSSIVQDESKASYSLWRDTEDYFINWNWSSYKIKRFIDAVGFPYNGAKTIINNIEHRILEAEIIDDVEIINRDVGKVIFVKDEKPVVVCGRGLLKILSMQNQENKNVKIKKFRTRFK